MGCGDVPDVLEPGVQNGLTISVRWTTLPGPTSVRIEALLGLLPVRVIVLPDGYFCFETKVWITIMKE